MLCIAHRGARSQAPENTIAAIELAIEQGAPAIEIDVRAHSGRLIVFHDDYLERTTNGHGAIEQQSLEYLVSLDAGGGEKIPFLEQVIKTIDRRAHLNIELKDSQANPLVVACVEQFVQQGWGYCDFTISSFIHRDLQIINQIQPKLPIGALIAGIPLNYALFAQQLNATSINLCAESINQAMIDDAHQRGLKVYVYTVNDLREYARFNAMGVDGLFTDYPSRLMEWLNQA